MSEWKKVNGKLCKPMSQESKDKLRAFENEQPFRYPPLGITPPLTIPPTVFNYEQNKTLKLEKRVAYLERNLRKVHEGSNRKTVVLE